MALAWTPFWLGSNRLFAWGVNGVLFPMLTAIYELNLLLKGRPHPIALRRLRMEATLFIAVVAWIALQMSALVPLSLTHPIWGMAQEALGRPLEATISVNRSETYIALIRLLTCASLFWLALQLSRRALRADLLLRAINMSIAAYAFYGLVLTAFFSGIIPLLDLAEGGGFVRSTFVNRNNFATYAGLGLIVTTGLILRLLRIEAPATGGDLRYRLARFFQAAGQKAWSLLGVSLVILAALLGSGSRGAILASLLGVVALLILSFSRDKVRKGGRYNGLLLIALSLFAGFYFLGDIFWGRIKTAGFEDASRISVDVIVLRSILDTPLTGFGYGTFTDVFPMYRDQSISVIGVWDKAHNSWLELLQGLGLIFGVALIAVIGRLAARCFAGAARRRENATPAMIAAAASVLVGVHAVVDFSLQIEAVALTYLAILAAGCAQAESSQLSLAD